MKKIYLAFITLSLLFIATSCDKDLPYPIDDVKRGVVIDIVRAAGSDGALNRNETDGNYKVKLVIPEQQGDYSFMKNAQLIAVLESKSVVKGSDGKDSTVTTYKSEVVVDNITEFPKEISIDIASVYSKLGKTVPLVGETLYLTTNTVLSDGEVIQGWNEVIGFNNKAFAGWRVDGRAYSYSVRYPVVCPLFLEDFVGTNTITDGLFGATYPVEIVKISDTELHIEGMFFDEADFPLKMIVNPDDYSIKIAKQVLKSDISDWLGEAPGTYTNFGLDEGSGIIDACENSITFTASTFLDGGLTLGKAEWVIRK